MIFPSLSALPNDPYDFTIIGSGFAGLYIAEALEKAGFRSLIIEQGPLDQPHNEGRGYYEIDATGIDYLPLSERLAAFGGTSGHWAGQSRPMSAKVFAERPYLDCPGWPIAFAEFEPHLDAAKAWLHQAHGPDDTIYDAPADGFLPGPNTGLTALKFAIAQRVSRLNGDLRPWIETSEAVHLLPSHRATNLHLAPSGQRVSEIEVAQIAPRLIQRLPVRNLILATGGIENARLMLVSARDLMPGNPFSGRHGRTGLAFQEHPKFAGVELFLDDNFPLQDTVWREASANMNNLSAYSLDEALFEQFELPRFAVFFWGKSEAAEEVGENIDNLDRLLHGGTKRYRRSVPEFAFEQLPHDDSYVALSEKTDVLGQPLARLHWTIDESQRRACWRAINVFSGLIAQCGGVRPRLLHSSAESFLEHAETRIQHHPMGTTAMSNDARTGVVDTNCRVHGLENLHVAGSSVFATSDHVNPTLNILALADRLVHHLIATTS